MPAPLTIAVPLALGGGTLALSSTEILAAAGLGGTAIYLATPEGQERAALLEDWLLFRVSEGLSQAARRWQQPSAPQTPPPSFDPHLPAGSELLILAGLTTTTWDQVRRYEKRTLGDGFDPSPEDQQEYWRWYRVQQLKIQLQNNPQDIQAEFELRALVRELTAAWGEELGGFTLRASESHNFALAYYYHPRQIRRRYQIPAKVFAFLKSGQLDELRLGSQGNVTLSYDAKQGRFFVRRVGTDGIAILGPRNLDIQGVALQIETGNRYVLFPGHDVSIGSREYDFSAADELIGDIPPDEEPWQPESLHTDADLDGLLIGGTLRNFRHLKTAMAKMPVGSSFIVDGRITARMPHGDHPQVEVILLEIERVGDEVFRGYLRRGRIKVESPLGWEYIEGGQKFLFNSRMRLYADLE